MTHSLKFKESKDTIVYKVDENRGAIVCLFVIVLNQTNQQTTFCSNKTQQ
jgi:hypothetical protein